MYSLKIEKVICNKTQPKNINKIMAATVEKRVYAVRCCIRPEGSDSIYDEGYHVYYRAEIATSHDTRMNERTMRENIYNIIKKQFDSKICSIGYTTFTLTSYEEIKVQTEDVLKIKIKRITDQEAKNMMHG
jgi:hypothetical protein